MYIGQQITTQQQYNDASHYSKQGQQMCTGEQIIVTVQCEQINLFLTCDCDYIFHQKTTKNPVVENS